MERDHSDPLISTNLGGRYLLEAKIGSGGMSSVYRAKDSVLERVVAIKVLHREHRDDEKFLERFRQEARSVAKLSHPYIVNVIDAGEDEGHPFIVFEYIAGETLKQCIARKGPLPIPEAVAYAIEIGKALQAAHERNLVHRDVKPQNVLLDEEGHAKVTDFGIARSLELEGMTDPGTVLGTTDYVSPEQALGKDVSSHSDTYSLGIVLYEMITGAPPFKGEGHIEVAMRHVREELPDIQKLRPELSAALAAIVEKATSKETKNRYQSVSEMVSELEQVLGYEIARAGESSEETTAVLEALSESDTDAFPALRKGRRLFARIVRVVAIVAALAVVGIAVTLVLENKLKDGSPSSNLKSVPLSSSDIKAYDPAPGDGEEHSEITGSVVDGLPSTFWDSERYISADFGQKQGVGLLFNLHKSVPARVVELRSPHAGYNVQVWGANNVPKSIENGWTLLAEKQEVGKVEKIKLDTVDRSYRHYLIWITRLGGSSPYYAQISEVKILA